MHRPESFQCLASFPGGCGKLIIAAFIICSIRDLSGLSSAAILRRYPMTIFGVFEMIYELSIITRSSPSPDVRKTSKKIPVLSVNPITSGFGAPILPLGITFMFLSKSHSTIPPDAPGSYNSCLNDKCDKSTFFNNWVPSGDVLISETIVPISFSPSLFKFEASRPVWPRHFGEETAASTIIPTTVFLYSLNMSARKLLFRPAHRGRAERGWALGSEGVWGGARGGKTTVRAADGAPHGRFRAGRGGWAEFHAVSCASRVLF